MLIDVALLSNVIWLTISLVTLSAVIHYMFVPTMVEEFRQHVFNARRELFQLIVQGKLSPDHPGYLAARNSMNSILQYAERITLMRILLSGIICKKNSDKYAESFANAVESVENEAVRAKIKELHIQVGFRVIWLGVVTSPLGWLLSIISGVVVLLAAATKFLGHSWKWVKDAIKLRASHLAQPIEAHVYSMFSVSNLQTSGARAAMADTRFFGVL